MVAETERQVVAHLQGHLGKLPETDARSRGVVAQMQADEHRHAEAAVEAGAAGQGSDVAGLTGDDYHRALDLAAREGSSPDLNRGMDTLADIGSQSDMTRQRRAAAA